MQKFGDESCRARCRLIYEQECRQGTLLEKSEQLLRTGLTRPMRDLYEIRSRISKLELDPTILPQRRLP